MAPEECPHFILKRHFAMVFYLVLNVFPDFVYIGLTHRKTGVSALPLELFVIRTFASFHPLGTALLDFFNNLFERMILGERKQCVDVIFDAADNVRWTFPLSEQRGVGDGQHEARTQRRSDHRHAGRGQCRNPRACRRGEFLLL